MRGPCPPPGSNTRTMSGVGPNCLRKYASTASSSLLTSIPGEGLQCCEVAMPRTRAVHRHWTGRPDRYATDRQIPQGTRPESSRLLFGALALANVERGAVFAISAAWVARSHTGSANATGCPSCPMTARPSWIR